MIRPRCPWADGSAEYAAYHDDEWGTELHGDDALYERLTLEAFQSGLSWLTILRKREHFRSAFANFNILDVAEFDEAQVARLLADSGIVRNRAKISAAIGNARAAAAVPGGLDALLWSFAPSDTPRPAASDEIPTRSAESTAMASELKRRGFTFVGPITCYSLMQATGMVFDHVPRCWRWWNHPAGGETAPSEPGNRPG